MGTMIYKNGDQYQGNWEEGEFSNGKMSYKSGKIYDGEWKRRLYNGKGKLI